MDAQTDNKPSGKTATQIAINALFVPGDVVELRVLKAGKFKTISGYFNDFTKLAEEVDGLSGKYTGIYYTLNPVDPALLARANNVTKPYAIATTSAVNILRRRWLLIDCDPIGLRVSVRPTRKKHTHWRR